MGKAGAKRRRLQSGTQEVSYSSHQTDTKNKRDDDVGQSKPKKRRRRVENNTAIELSGSGKESLVVRVLGGSLKPASPEGNTATLKDPSLQEDKGEIEQPDFPFAVEPDDHCESPLEAYKDIACLLQECCHSKPSTLGIYDPYYCDGAAARHLQQLGFPHVYNKKEDCYRIWAHPELYPTFDILITNPPYSGDHVERLIRHVTSSSFRDKPWFLLLPTWVHKKDYYINATSDLRPFYLVPRSRYVYLPPRNFRAAKKSDVHKKSSPFVSMWYIWGGSHSKNEALIRRFYQSVDEKCATCDLARSKSALRDLRRKKR